MAIKSREEIKWKTIEIDLTGPDGNVFVLMGTAKRLACQIFDKNEPELEEAQMLAEIASVTGLDYGVVPKSMGELIVNEMMQSDYEHAIQTFDRYFGNFVTLYR
jgi:hypothetical protein